MMVLELWKDLLFPRKCILCGAVLGTGENDLCRACAGEESPAARNGEALEDLDQVCVVWDYRDKARKSLHRFKFGNRPGYAGGYGRRLAMALLRGGVRGEIITWVPMSRERKKERGYDQAELLARAVGRELGIPAFGTLRKVRDNPAQSTLTDRRQRMENVRDVYEILPDTNLNGKTVILVDDILTTGATSRACARVLRKAGAAKVCLAVVAAAVWNQKDRTHAPRV